MAYCLGFRISVIASDSLYKVTAKYILNSVESNLKGGLVVLWSLLCRFASTVLIKWQRYLTRDTSLFGVFFGFLKVIFYKDLIGFDKLTSIFFRLTTFFNFHCQYYYIYYYMWLYSIHEWHTNILHIVVCTCVVGSLFGVQYTY